MIQEALRMYHIPEDIQVMLEDYFNGFKMRFLTERYTTHWINLEVGIVMVVQYLQFRLAMEVAAGSASPADLGGGCYVPSLKAFMDCTMILCSKENETLRMLVRLDTLMDWSRMSFKPKKSRSLSLRKGKLDESASYKVAGQNIPRISQEPFKSLGRWYDSSLKDKV
ncbi:reverse transcriptase [Plakobranchus ocellatus]|uniref:Reverse transcriptase n=1 Tax=Plakobranchus ocellatus TaxID=259542 RepID=A0AAV4ASJ6_9GAST|nr:reverse transcriptase [Plakobranchus ocellatus]